MKSHKVILKTLLCTFCASLLIVPNVVQAKTTIDTLDVRLTGIDLLDCEVLGKVDLERDPSWSDNDFYINLLDKYMVDVVGMFPSVEEYREDTLGLIRDNWDSLAKNIYINYAKEWYPDYYTREEYYSTFNEDLKDDYHKAYNFYSFDLPASGFPDFYSYDIIANYCSAENQISTTYDNDGYFGYFKLGDREIVLEEEYEHLIPIANGYRYYEDGFADLTVEFSKTDATTIVAKYTIKNLSGEATDFGLAYYSDVELGENDDSAVQKTEKDITITQDNSTYYPNTFGAQFKIKLSPDPSTIFIGQYYTALEKRWENSKETYFTAVDEVDTGLAYSWTGQLADGESKSFSTTYFIREVDGMFNNDFYYLSDSYSSPRHTYQAVDGGALRLAEVDNSNRIGYHNEWNTKADGTGKTYKSGKTIIADKNATKYYEQQVPNSVYSDVQKNGMIFKEQDFVITDEVRERYADILQAAYSDVTLASWIYELDDYDIEDIVNDGTIDLDKVAEVIDDKDAGIESIFAFTELEKYYNTEPGETEYYVLEPEDFPLTVRMKLYEENYENKDNFSLIRAIFDEETEKYVDYVKIPTRFNRETGELFFDIEAFIPGDGFILTAKEKPEEPTPDEPTPDEPEGPDAPIPDDPEDPGVPNTGVYVKEDSSAAAVALVSLPILVVAAYIAKKLLKR